MTSVKMSVDIIIGAGYVILRCQWAEGATGMAQRSDHPTKVQKLSSECLRNHLADLLKSTFLFLYSGKICNKFLIKVTISYPVKGNRHAVLKLPAERPLIVYDCCSYRSKEPTTFPRSASFRSSLEILVPKAQLNSYI